MNRYFYFLDEEDQRLIQYNKSQESTNCSSRDIFLGLYSIAGDPERGHKEAESSWGKDTILFCVLSLACFFAFSLVFVFLCMPLCALLLVPACFGSFFSLCASLYFYFRKSMCLGMFVRSWMCVFILCLCVYLYPVCVYGSLSLALCHLHSRRVPCAWRTSRWRTNWESCRANTLSTGGEDDFRVTSGLYHWTQQAWLSLFSSSPT